MNEIEIKSVAVTGMYTHTPRVYRERPRVWREISLTLCDSPDSSSREVVSRGLDSPHSRGHRVGAHVPNWAPTAVMIDIVILKTPHASWATGLHAAYTGEGVYS